MDKSKWGDGPWQHEPDNMQFKDETTGYPCLIVRGPVGVLCGYVGISKEHPAYDRKDMYDFGDIGVHGGVTFFEGFQPRCEGQGVCHAPPKGEDDVVKWVGFDCAHSGDYCPQYGEFKDVVLCYFRNHPINSYKDIAYVKEEIQSMAKQLKGMERLEEE